MVVFNIVDVAYDVSTVKVFVRYKTVLYLTKTFTVKTLYAAVICYMKAHQHNSAMFVYVVCHRDCGNDHIIVCYLHGSS